MKKLLIVGAVIAVGGIAAMLLAGFMFPKNRTLNRKDEDRFIKVLRSSIRYRIEENKGHTLIMLHGFGGDLTDWEPLTGEISFAKIISLDLIGFGLSDRPEITYDLETQRRYLIAFMDDMKISRAFLVGTSMGASVALWTASRSPDRVSGLVLFAPSAYPGSMHHRWPGDHIYRPGPLNRTLRAITGSWLYDTLFPRSLGKQALDITASYTDAFTAGLGSVKHPILLIWSKGDRRVPFSYSQRYRELLPQAQFIEAPRELGHNAAGHPNREIVAGICMLVSHGKRTDSLNGRRAPL